MDVKYSLHATGDSDISTCNRQINLTLLSLHGCKNLHKSGDCDKSISLSGRYVSPIGSSLLNLSQSITCKYNVFSNNLLCGHPEKTKKKKLAKKYDYLV